jgi:hypothetical protein
LSRKGAKSRTGGRKRAMLMARPIKQESRWACRRSGSSHLIVGLTGRLSIPSNGRGNRRRCGGGRTEWRASNVKWKDDTHPPANIVPAIISLVHVGREIALQDHRAEVVAEEAAHRELALLLVAEKRLGQIGGIVTDPSHLPLAEAMAHRHINVDEIWITSKAGGELH